MNKKLVSEIFNVLKNNRERGLELIEKHIRKTIYGVAFSYTKDHQLSEDIIQDVYMKLHNLDSVFLPSKSELSWLYTVTKNISLKYLDKRNKYSLKDEIDSYESNDKVFEDDTFNDMIDNLSDIQKEIISLKIRSDLTHKEIGQLLNKPPGTIQWLYSVSLKQLRKTLVTLTLLLGVTGLLGFGRYGYLYYDYKNLPDGINPDINMELLYFDQIALYSLTIFLLTGIIIVFILNLSKKFPTKSNLNVSK